MKLTRQNKFFLLIEGMIIFFFFLSHSTPTLAIRTNLFFSGQFSDSFSCKLVEASTKKDKYTLTPPAYEKSTQSELTTYQVKRYCGFFYFARYQGEV
ncbi:hypothetical protein IGI37_002548 [Enterococcus sp. AZ194]